MKTAGKNVSIFTSRSKLKRVLDEYEDFDAASRLCADYCINANDIALMSDENPKPRKSKSRLTFTSQSDENRYIGPACLVAQ